MLASPYGLCAPAVLRGAPRPAPMPQPRAAVEPAPDGAPGVPVPHDIHVLLTGAPLSYGALSARVAEAFGGVGARITRRGNWLTLRAALSEEGARIATSRLLARLPGAVVDRVEAVDAA
jgi:hypothetical protein